MLNLEDVGQISQIEDIVELDGSRKEGLRNFVVKDECGANHGSCLLLNAKREAVLLEMLTQNVRVHVRQSIVA